jgi:Glycosyl transferase family 2
VNEGTLISFVVIAYNEAGNIGRTLGAITSMACLGRYEVIVVDDGSGDRTADVVADIARRNPRVRLISLHRNHGRGYARSKGIAAARGDFIATVDADIILPKNWLVRVREALDGHDAVGATAVPDGDAAYLHKRFRLTPRAVGHTTAVTGSNALYRRQVFDTVGFDPGLREGEDIALNHLARLHGLSFVTVPALLVQHTEDKTLLGSLRWLFVSGKGATRQLLTYREVRPPDLATGAFGAAAAAGLLIALRGKRLAGASIPAALVLAVSSQHVRSRFETPWRQWSRVMPAIAVDSVLLTAYFTGRLAGLAGLCRQLPVTTRPSQSRLRRPSFGHGKPVRVSGDRGDGHPAVARCGQDIPKKH